MGTMMSQLALLNSPLALILTCPGLVIPFGTWVLWSFFRGLPRDLIDQARLEGARTRDVLLKVVGPVAPPQLAAVLLCGLPIVFNDYFYAFEFVADESAPTHVTAA